MSGAADGPGTRDRPAGCTRPASNRSWASASAARPLVIEPCIPRAWPRYEIDFAYHSSRYEIEVENPHGVSRGVVSAELDGRVLPGPGASTIPLPVRDGGVHSREGDVPRLARRDASVAGSAARVLERAAAGRDELPRVAGRAQGELDHAMGQAVSNLAVGPDGREAPQRGAAGADHELTDADCRVGRAARCLGANRS